MNYLKQIQKGVDFIEENLARDIASSEVARHAGISHWHFQRMFKAITNETLKTYIRSRRLANALETLLDPNVRILEIAMEAGFESQEAFTRAFKKAFGVTPASYRRRGSRFQFMRKVRIDAEYLTHINTNVSLEPIVYEQPALRLVGLKTHYFGVDSEKNNMGDKLPGLWAAFLARIAEIPNTVPGLCYGVVRQTQEGTDELEYFACIAVNRVEKLPSDMVEVHLPAARYAQFTHCGQPRELNKTIN
jgi:AraC-like DNA-binding protein/predicted transcriptional regulator YdeE